jgi:hypothetical protein
MRRYMADVASPSRISTLPAGTTSSDGATCLKMLTILASGVSSDISSRSGRAHAKDALPGDGMHTAQAAAMEYERASHRLRVTAGGTLVAVLAGTGKLRL